MKILKLLFLSILFIGMNSCSSSDEEGESGVASITITASTATQMVGEDITFIVTTDTGEDVTTSSTITAGSTVITGATFTSAAAGNFTITATYAGKSATVPVTFTDVPPSSIVLTASETTQSIGEDITFTVMTDTGVNVTSTAVITVAGNAITGNTFTSATVGSFDVVATFEAFTSGTVTVNFTPVISFEKRVLIEDYTGTWCGWCPRVSYGIEQVNAVTDNAVVVAIHSGSTNPSSNGYDPYNFTATALDNLIGLEGYPTAMLNRMTSWNYPEPNNVNQVVNLTEGTAPKLGLAMTSTVADGNISLEVKTKFGKNYTGAKLVVYILENGLIFDQVNYTDYYGGADIISDFSHEHVLRASLTNLLGDAFTANESVYDNEVTKTFNIPVPANVSNASNIEFVAFVVGDDNKAINVRKSAPGESQTFEIIE